MMLQLTIDGEINDAPMGFAMDGRALHRDAKSILAPPFPPLSPYR